VIGKMHWLIMRVLIKTYNRKTCKGNIDNFEGLVFGDSFGGGELAAEI
jgi:hypothetical protein